MPSRVLRKMRLTVFVGPVFRMTIMATGVPSIMRGVVFSYLMWVNALPQPAQIVIGIMPVGMPVVTLVTLILTIMPFVTAFIIVLAGMV